MKRIQSLVLLLSLALCGVAGRGASFEIGESDFLLDGKPLKIHCGEMHYARIPRAYWRHRLQMLKAMGMNAVGCYMFWNYHEREPGKFTWEGRADAAAFCRMAQEEGLWVVLRPGPYSCAEWEGGGAPAWLLKDDAISMRSSDPKWTGPAKRWIAEVGRVFAPLQVTRGGPILMVQVENEYGLHGNDAAYIETLRQATVDAGFEVPLYACNPPRVIRNGFNAKLFQAANFGADPEQRFGIVREVQPKGPLMCAEYYPAWFDTWGAKHNGPKRDRDFFGPIDWMLDRGASFSLYMAHGGTSFGGWTGCRNPFVPNVTSYDFAAPIDEQGRPNPSFFKLRDRLARHLNPGETLGKMPEPIPVKAFGEAKMTRVASVTAFMTSVANAFDRPVASEKLDLPFGLVAWTTTVPAGLSGDLAVENIHDFGYASLDGIRLGTFDRRHRGVKLTIAPADVPRALTIVVEAMGRINSSQGMEDRKGLFGRVTIGGTELTKWTASVLPIDPDRISPDRFVQAAGPTGDRSVSLPSVYAGVLSVDEPADTFLDLRGFNKGIVFVNGWNLGRYWRIGPQQTLYLPGCWLKKGANAVRVVEMFEPAEPVVRSVATPVLDELHPEDDFNRVAREVTKFPGGAEVASGEFPNTDAAQVVMLKEPVLASQFALQALSSHDRDAKKPFASIAEFDLLDERGEPITNAGLAVAGVDSEEEVTMDGVAENAIDGQVESFWYATARALPHWIAFRTPKPVKIHGFRYTPCVKNRGRIQSWRFLVSGVVAAERTERNGKNESGRVASGCVFTTEIAEGSGKNGTEQPDRPENAADYTPFSPLAIRCVTLRLHLPMAKKPKSAAPRFEELRTELVSLLPCRGADFNTESQRHGGTEEENRCVKHGDLSVPLCLCTSVLRKQVRERFRSHSFARSVADLGFSPDENWSRLEAKEGEWARNRIIGHGFRTGTRTGRIFPHFPFHSVCSVVKTQQKTKRPLNQSGRFRSLPLISAPSAVKDTARDDPTTKDSEEPKT